MIRADKLSLNFGDQTIFNNISFSFQNDQRVGLVGRNGSGKTTLLKMIADTDSNARHGITQSKNQKVAYMPQHVVLQSDKSVFDEAYSTFSELYALEQKRIKLEQTLEQDSSCTTALEELAITLEELKEYNIPQTRLKIEKILKGLGFSDEQLHTAVNQLSVGWKMRIVLAKLLLQEADFYLFDEPTNHLDIFAKDWFLSFLENASFGFLIVCHERYFLDKLCSHIYELERGNGTLYQGNYHDYEQQKERNKEAQLAAYTQQQRELAQKQAVVDRFRAKATKAKMAKSMEKALDKIERIEAPEGNQKTIHFDLKPRQQSGRTVLTVSKVAHAFGTKKIFENASFIVERHQKVAVVAPNGVGKTTLFNLVAGLLKLQTGTIEFGYNVDYALFHQDQDLVLNPEATIFQEVSAAAPKKTDQEVRTLLGNFLFSNAAIDKKIKVLSGGEKNRVSMVKVLLQDANFLLLDEPTNHLDLQSKEVLLHVLQKYKGTILFVSHDHDFINHLATHVIELTRQGTKLYIGNYRDYLENRKHANALLTPKKDYTEQKSAKIQRMIDTKERFALEKEARKFEQAINKIEHTITKLHEKFAVIDYGTPEYAAAAKRLKELEAQHEEAMSSWEEVQKKIS